MKTVRSSRESRRNFVRSVLITIGYILICEVVFAGLVGLVIVLPFPPGVSDDARFAYVFVPALLVIAGIIIWRSQVYRRRSNPLETAFNSLGLIGSGFIWRGRQYHGKLKSRQVDAYFYRGASLDIYLAAPFNTRLGICLKGHSNEVDSRLVDLPELIIDDPALTRLGIVALDEGWCRALLSDQGAKAAVLRLVAVQPVFELCSLSFYPDALYYQLRWVNMSELSPEDLFHWIGDLLELAEIAQVLSPPVVTSVATAREKASRIRWNDFDLSCMGVACGFFLFLALIVIILVIFILIIEAGG